MTDKQICFVEQLQQCKKELEKLAAEIKKDNPYNYTLNSMFDWLFSCFKSIEINLTKNVPHKPCALDFDHPEE